MEFMILKKGYQLRWLKKLIINRLENESKKREMEKLQKKNHSKEKLQKLNYIQFVKFITVGFKFATMSILY